jgi:hypothetical protein
MASPPSLQVDCSSVFERFHMPLFFEFKKKACFAILLCILHQYMVLLPFRSNSAACLCLHPSYEYIPTIVSLAVGGRWEIQSRIVQSLIHSSSFIHNISGRFAGQLPDCSKHKGEKYFWFKYEY